MSLPTPRMIPARYIGHHPIIIKVAAGVELRDGDGQPLAGGRLLEQPNASKDATRFLGYQLAPDQTLMMPATEVLGETVIVETSGTFAPRHLGPGWRSLPDMPEHAGKSWAEMQGVRFQWHDDNRLWCYQFSEGRADFEPLLDEDDALADDSSSTPADVELPSADTRDGALASSARDEDSDGDANSVTFPDDMVIDESESDESDATTSTRAPESEEE